MERIVRERRLKWVGHVFRMDESRLPNHKHAVYVEGSGYHQIKDRKTKIELDGSHKDVKI